MGGKRKIRAAGSDTGACGVVELIAGVSSLWSLDSSLSLSSLSSLSLS